MQWVSYKEDGGLLHFLDVLLREWLRKTAIYRSLIWPVLWKWKCELLRPNWWIRALGFMLTWWRTLYRCPRKRNLRSSGLDRSIVYSCKSTEGQPQLVVYSLLLHVLIQEIMAGRIHYKRSVNPSKGPLLLLVRLIYQLYTADDATLDCCDPAPLHFSCHLEMVLGWEGELRPRLARIWIPLLRWRGTILPRLSLRCLSTIGLWTLYWTRRAVL